ncbi:MAG: DegV family protein [Lachnospiraceae bacterium]|nr:DegV family protein [Lachnospiraceae bacterium]
MSYKIVVDSCCELPEEYKRDSRFEIVSLGLQVGDWHTMDDENFDQAEFLRKVAACTECPRSSCPSPEKYMESYRTEAEHVYVVTLSSHLSGSHNSAVVGRDLYYETYGKKKIHIVDSESASCGETQIALKAMELEESGKYSFEEIVGKLEEFRDRMATFFVLDNLDTLRKNGRLTGVKSLVASTLNIKPVMQGVKGEIVQAGQAIGVKKALAKMADLLVQTVGDCTGRTLMITHCNNPDRAELMRELVLKRAEFLNVRIMDTAGISSMYANDGGVIITA